MGFFAFMNGLYAGHRYGNDIIPISEEDKVNMGYKPPGKLMQVLGFTKQENVSVSVFMSWHDFIYSFRKNTFKLLIHSTCNDYQNKSK